VITKLQNYTTQVRLYTALHISN